MKTTELRIGNYVTEDYSNSVYKIVNINSEGFEYVDMHHINFKAIGRYELKGLKPIPVTEQVLIDCGFEKLNDSICKIAINNTIYLWYFGIMGYHDKSGGIVYLCDCKHLHQLQNLYFALTNQELIYNPNGNKE